MIKGWQVSAMDSSYGCRRHHRYQTLLFLVCVIAVVASCSTGLVSLSPMQSVDWQPAQSCLPANIQNTTVVKIKDVTFLPTQVSFQQKSVQGGPVFQLTGEAGISYEGILYRPVALRIVAPSDHAVVSLPFLMELQIFAVSENALPVAVSIFVRKGASQSNEALHQLITSSNGQDQINFANLRPQYGGHYRYTGSLPVPPCKEIRWLVMKSSITASVSDFEEYLKRWPHQKVRPFLNDETSVLIEETE